MRVTDVLHNVSHALVSQYDVICLEDLNIKGMIRNRRLSKHIADARWGSSIKPVRLLEYKAAWNNKHLIQIDRFFPSSKACHVCGWIHPDWMLSVRAWTCNGHALDRDDNTAKNMLNQGLHRRRLKQDFL